MDEEKIGFAARGGWWVLAQVPVLLAALILPLLQGAASFDGGNGLQVAGAAVTVLGLVLAFAGIAQLGRCLTPFPHPPARAPLRQSGAYRWVRHPIYAGLLTASLGWSLTWLSIAGGAFCVVVAAFFDRKSALEERFLQARHPEYQDYMRRVRKLVPWIY